MHKGPKKLQVKYNIKMCKIKFHKFNRVVYTLDLRVLSPIIYREKNSTILRHGKSRMDSVITRPANNNDDNNMI